jgi:CBS domain-containing protein
MSTDVVTCQPETWLAMAAKRMWDHRIGFLPVVDPTSGELVGTLTDRDGFMAAYTQGKRLWDLPVGVAMAHAPKSCRADAPIEEAEQLMGTHRVRRLPVVDGANRVIGVLSLDDIARWAARTGDELLEQEVAVALGTIASAPDGELPIRA